MREICNHNRFASELASRLAPDPFVEHRVRELNTFEARARGDNTAAIAAKVANPKPGATTMNVHQSDTLTRPSSVFQPAANKSAFLKMGIMGKQGAGKTKTAGKVAIGLVRHLKELGISYASKPVAFFDTETGSDYLIPDFEAAGIPLVVAKTKTLADLVKAMDEAEANCSALIIDSITHPYREMVAAYLKKKNRTFLQIDDYQYLQGDYGWAMFTNRFINSKLHIVMCGRAGDDLEQYTDESGRRQLEKVGVKMKGHAETGFEPSLLIEMKLMERNNREQGSRKRTFVHMATVVKDRWDVIDGDEIDDPDFVDFLPHISRLALGGEHVGIRDTGDSQSILKTEKRDWHPVQREIVLGEIKDLLTLHADGQTAADKQRRITLLKTHFHAGWVEIEKTMSLPDLRAGFDTMHQELEGKPSRYGTAIAKDAQSNDINDSLPDGMAPLAAVTAAVTETLAPAAAVDTSTVSANGIPAFLDRNVPADADAIDEPKWLAELTKAFEASLDFADFGKWQQTLMAPFKSRVTAPTWKKAVKLATACVARLAEGPADSLAVAAE